MVTKGCGREILQKNSKLLLINVLPFIIFIPPESQVLLKNGNIGLT